VAERLNEWSSRRPRIRLEDNFEVDLREMGYYSGRLKGTDSGSRPMAVCGIFEKKKTLVLSSEVTFCLADMIDV
jgi:hypothetical protein